MKNRIDTYVKMDIQTTIDARLKLQSTQKNLNDLFDIHLPSTSYLKLPVFKNKYGNWDDETKNKFIEILGGKVNYRRTKEFIGKI